MPLAVCMCSEITSVTTSSETIGCPDRGLSQRTARIFECFYKVTQTLWNTCVFGDDFGDKHTRIPHHSSHFDNTVLPIHHELSQAESFRWHV